MQSILVDVFNLASINFMHLSFTCHGYY